MEVSTSWHYQDVLELSVNQWCDALQNPLVFHDYALRMVCFVFQQPNYTSVASDIAAAFSTPETPVHHNQITACNRKVAKALYAQYGVQPPSPRAQSQTLDMGVF